MISLLVGFGAGGLLATIVFFLTRPRAKADGVLLQKIDILGGVQEREERMLREEMARARQENAQAAKTQREELRAALMGFSDTFATQTGKLTESNEQRLESLRSIVDLRLKQLQDDNSKQIDKMRATVDEKLQGTLEKRLGESFKQVSDGLARVFEVSGEMKTLAMGVGDLKRVLSNVTTRGHWGEIQLEKLLEQILTTDQYERRVRVNESSGEMVDFAIKLPGKNGNGNGKSDVVWLPIDAKFPTEDYQRLVEAQEKGDVDAAEAAGKMLGNRLRDSAKDICAKYIRPPKTTDFGIMFLPTEGLYAEMVRRRGLFEIIQRECRVMIAGPTTLAALLNSLQMGFRSLTIQKRSSEVWQLLSSIKAEFGKFSDLLDGVKKKLDQASSTMEDASRKSRTIEKKLKRVEELPEADANVLLKDLIPEAAADD
ncbi:MAG: DNA recombination protein RmuC [Spartobacteria bacterium]